MNRLIAALVFVLISLCSHAAEPPITVDECPIIAGLPEGNLLLFGEMHGSMEAPALIYRIACALSESSKVAVGIEIPSTDQPLIDAYLASQGTAADVKSLTSSDSWQRVKDGRTSIAMLGLIEKVRILRSRGHLISIFAFDDQPGTELDRDVAIANGIRRFYLTGGNEKIIALMGNIHAMQEPFAFDGKDLVPSGMLLKDLHPVSIFIAYPAGTIWACMPTCGIQTLKAIEGIEASAGFQPGSPLGGYSHSYLLPTITASKPAVE